MTYKVPFPGSAKLDETESTLIAYQLGAEANLVDIVGLEATFTDGTTMNVNVAELDPVNDITEIHTRLAFVLVADVDYGAMAAAGMTQLGGAGHVFNIFVADVQADIFIFFRR